MSAWLSANIGTIAVLLILAAAVFLIIRYIVREKRKGHSFCAGTSCGGDGCSGNCKLCHGGEFPKDIKIKRVS